MDFVIASRAWEGLRKLCPRAIAAVLMPNHLHLILPAELGPKSARKIYGLMGALSRGLGIQRLWQPIPEPRPIPDRQHLLRQIRYVALNPCRKGLCRDPLEWQWSTYRDVMGAAADVWVSAGYLSRILEEKSNTFKVRIHDYVSSDPTVNVAGSPSPVAAQEVDWAERSVGEVLRAAAAALRVPVTAVEDRGRLRSLFVHLAYQQGWRQPALLGRICRLTPRAIRLILDQEPPPSEIQAALLCLGDARLCRDPGSSVLPKSGRKRP